jgi:hypothetical protein
MSQILTNRSEWSLEPLDKECRLEDIDKALAIGDHKGASLQPDLLRKLVTKDVQFGCCPPPANRESKEYPRDPTCPDEHPEAEKDQQARADC